MSSSLLDEMEEIEEELKADALERQMRSNRRGFDEDSSDGDEEDGSSGMYPGSSETDLDDSENAYDLASAPLDPLIEEEEESISRGASIDMYEYDTYTNNEDTEGEKGETAYAVSSVDSDYDDSADQSSILELSSASRRRSKLFGTPIDFTSTTDTRRSVGSAPGRFDAASGSEELVHEFQGHHRRRVTLNLPSQSQSDNLNESESFVSQRRNRHRVSFYRQSGASSARTNSGSHLSYHSDPTDTKARPNLLRRISSHFLPASAKRASRHQSQIFQRQNSSTVPHDVSLTDAVSRLGAQQHNSDWENVAAAAAIVAASSSLGKRGLVQFGKDDHVLVMLTLLNITNSEVDKEMFTVHPVNTYGYPAGEGKTENQKQGPHQYVLCIVKNVHFDEDERYYTVRRVDSGTEQRADPGWMAPLKDSDGLEAAYIAAHRTLKYETEAADQEVEDHGFLLRITDTVRRVTAWPAHFFSRRVIPCYQTTRAAAKIVALNTLHGESGYGCKMRLTAINFLVLCSFIFLFFDIVGLAFLDPKHDHTIALTGLVVWIILAIELIFEFIIRPPNYFDLMQSEKAFAPATARHINRYHLFCEVLALLLFIPQMSCVFDNFCGESMPLSLVQASIDAITSQSTWKAAAGRVVIGLTFLRVFGLVRHWKQMWLSHTFVGSRFEEHFVRELFLAEKEKGKEQLKRKLKDDPDRDLHQANLETPSESKPVSNEEDQQLTGAATIGTALMLVNSHRALFMLLCVVTVFPAINSLYDQNVVAPEQVALLQANNLIANTTDDCDFLFNAVSAWLRSMAEVYTAYRFYESTAENMFVLWAQVLPVRCDWQLEDGIITQCGPGYETRLTCQRWQTTWPNGSDPSTATSSYFAEQLGLRIGGVTEFEEIQYSSASFGFGSQSAPNQSLTAFEVKAIFNEGHTIAFVNTALLILLASTFMVCLLGLTVMRGDAGRLVLNPLQRMLRIVVRYAENPLSQTIQDKGRRKSRHSSYTSEISDEKSVGGSDDEGNKEQLGSYETVQLINAIAKIADLLRKCWGVAGAGIISTNLARTKDGKTVVFNPTVPGKRVYALFGFVAINDFSKQLRVLDRDVMILINDVARVVHDEVYRWALGDSGQCNKNLGAAFLMVFRIGDFTEVHDKKKKATEVVFNSQMKKNVRLRKRKSSRQGSRGSINRFDIGGKEMDTLQLASLPGIQGFADRALLAFLKSFAGINRDVKLQAWKKDFRLGAGVGAFSVSVIYGMDAGWAVEGAVGSEYKIDATYLSPHVNMASRMMSAAKQYGVTILLSKAVEELLSKPARAKLRHLDTVYVKGSNLKQPIYTYDARFEGVDFFLFERSPEQADSEADAYTANIWDVDQDLLSMRQHVDEKFMKLHKRGVEQYLEGKWKDAIETLQAADNRMIETVLEEGYIDYDDNAFGDEIFNRKSENEEVNRLQNDFGDGACKCLIHFMESQSALPPDDWNGVRHLTSK